MKLGGNGQNIYKNDMAKQFLGRTHKKLRNLECYTF